MTFQIVNKYEKSNIQAISFIKCNLNRTTYFINLQDNKYLYNNFMKYFYTN